MATPVKNVENLPIASAVTAPATVEVAITGLVDLSPAEAFQYNWPFLQRFINKEMQYGEYEFTPILKMQKDKILHFHDILRSIYMSYQFNTVNINDIYSIFKKLYDRYMGFFGERFRKIDRMHRRITFIIDEFGEFLENFIEKIKTREYPAIKNDEDNYSRGIANEEDNLEFKNFCNGLYDEALKVKGGNKTHKKRLFKKTLKKKYCKNKTCKKKYNKSCKKKYNKSCKRK